MDILDGAYPPQGALQKAGAVRPDSQRGVRAPSGGAGRLHGPAFLSGRSQ